MYTLPKLPIPKTKTDTIAAFRGLNERASIADNEFADCCNISLENAPALSVMDGCEDYLETELFGHMWVKSIGGYRLTKHGDKYLLRFYEQQDGIGAIEWPLPVPEDRIIGFDIYNGTLYFLTIPYGAGVFDLTYFEFKYTPEAECLRFFHRIQDTKIFANYSPDSLVCFMAFGSRMLIAHKGEIAISYHDNIEDWSTYKVDGYATEECAQRIQLLDDGDFTGCIKYRDYPIFFKENSMYILYGECAPFTLSRIDMVGCPYPDTIAVCNGALYFLSKSGVMEYTGGTPKLISQNADIPSTTFLTGHTACADNRYYYIANLAFDTYTRTWTKTFPDSPEIGVDPDEFSIQYQYRPQCYFEDQVYFLISENHYDPASSMVSFSSIVRTTEEVPADWSFTTKQFHEYQEGKKILSRLAIGFENVSLSELKIEVSLDKGEFKTVYTWDGSTDFVKEVPVLLPPCDYFQIRVSGSGKACIHYIKRRYRVLGV